MEKAVQRAREWLIEGQTDHAWWEYLEEMWRDALDQIGFTDAKSASPLSGRRVTVHRSQRRWTWTPGRVRRQRDQGEQVHRAGPRQCQGPRPRRGLPALARSQIGQETSLVNRRFRRLLKVRDYLGLHGTAHQPSLLPRNTSSSAGSSGPRTSTPAGQALWRSSWSAAESLRKDLCKAIYPDSKRSTSIS